MNCYRKYLKSYLPAGEDPISRKFFASVFAIGEHALERQSWRARLVNFGFVPANRSLQGTDILNSHFTNAIAKDVADHGTALAERIDAKTERNGRIGSKADPYVISLNGSGSVARPPENEIVESIIDPLVENQVTGGARRRLPSSARSPRVPEVRYGNRSVAEIADRPRHFQPVPARDTKVLQG